MLAFMEKQSTLAVLAICLLLMLIVFAFDYATGHELSFSIFYLLPISLAAWLRGRRAALAASVFGAGAWLVADVYSDQQYTDSAIPFWNMLVRFGFFAIVSVTLAALRAAQRRQEELSQFIVHDLRSPLSNTMVGLQTLEQLPEVESAKKATLLVDACLASCQRMYLLVNALLDSARLQRGQMPLQRQPLAVEELFEQASREVQLLCTQDQITLRAECGEKPLHIYADHELTVRVLVNLLSNAIRFSPANATVEVRAAAEGGQIVMRIIDRGSGIPAAWQSRIFDKFSQAGESSSTHTGSGLGLSYCREAIRAQSGRIWLESSDEQGTVIAFSLPAASHG